MSEGSIVLRGYGAGDVGSIAGLGFAPNFTILVFVPAPRHLFFDVLVTSDLSFNITGLPIICEEEELSIGSVVAFAGATAPAKHLLCDGASYTVASQSNLHAIIGYTYGGSGANFNVPDLRGRTILGTGTGAGLTARTLADAGGAENVTLAESEVAAHSHLMAIRSAAGNANGPRNNVLANEISGFTAGFHTTGPDGFNSMHADAISDNVGGDPHANVQPFVALNYIIKAT